MAKDITNMVQHEQEFAYVDSLITAQIESRPIVQITSAQRDGSEIVQSGTAQFENTPVPSILSLVTFTHHVEILNRCREYEEKVYK